jgi:hypothetical protein
MHKVVSNFVTVAQNAAAQAIDLVDEARWELAHSANIEVGLLAGHLLAEIMDGQRDAFELRIIARGLLKRIADLSEITSEALFLGNQEEREEVETLERRLGAPALLQG